MAENVRRDIVLNLEEMGFGVEVSHHELAPAQHEIDLEYMDGLTASRQHYDVQDGGQVNCEASRTACDLYAEAEGRCQWFRHAHQHVFGKSVRWHECLRRSVGTNWD